MRRLPQYSAELRDFSLAVLEGKPLDAGTRVFPRRTANGARHVPFGGKPALGEGVAIGAGHKAPWGLAHSNFVIRTEP